METFTILHKKNKKKHKQKKTNKNKQTKNKLSYMTHWGGGAGEKVMLKSQVWKMPHTQILVGYETNRDKA